MTKYRTITKRRCCYCYWCLTPGFSLSWSLISLKSRPKESNEVFTQETIDKKIGHFFCRMKYTEPQLSHPCPCPLIIQHVTFSNIKSSNFQKHLNLVNMWFSSVQFKKVFIVNPHITDIYYSILYYNSEKWHLKTLKPQLRQSLISGSARALKIMLKF